MSSDTAIGTQNLHTIDISLTTANTIKPVHAPSSITDERQAVPQQGNPDKQEAAIGNRGQKAARSADVANAVLNLSEMMKKFGHSVEFSVDKNTNQTVILIKNDQSSEVVRQIPTKEALELAQRIEEPLVINRQGRSPATSAFLVDEEI